MYGKLENVFITELYDCVLSRFDAAAKLLLSASQSLNTIVKAPLSLKEFVLHLRELDNFKELGKKKKLVKVTIKPKDDEAVAT